jgi:hypothetical protein
MSFKFIDIGLPFFDDINKQVKNQTYFASHSVSWISSDNRFLPFQVNSAGVSGMATFELVNSVTATTTNFLAHFNANTIETLVDGEYIYTYYGNVDVVVANGRYYFHAVSTGGREWWSEEFVMRGDITESDDFLLISKDDYLLIGGTDKLIIN